MKLGTVPSIFQWTQPPAVSAIERAERHERRQLATDFPHVSQPILMIPDSDFEVVQEEMCTTAVRDAEAILNVADSGNPAVNDAYTQTTDSGPRFDIKRLMFDPQAVSYYTGFETYSKFQLALESLGSAAYQLQYRWSQCVGVSVENQFFMTLMKLRCNKPNFEIARLFDVSEFSVSNIFVTWVNFMYHQWKEIKIWPSKENVHYYMSDAFKTEFPATRVIVDCTEVPVKKPSDPHAQQATFSTYKNRNTLKAMIGITPSGLISFVSDAYGGSCSDRQITERSCLMDLLEPGDSIMADKGFNVQDLFLKSGVTVNIPTFLRNRNRFQASSRVRDRRISSKRIHVERVIGLIKTYKILQEPMEASWCCLGSEIIYVCCMLCNFRKCIV